MVRVVVSLGPKVLDDEESCQGWEEHQYTNAKPGLSPKLEDFGSNFMFISCQLCDLRIVT